MTLTSVLGDKAPIGGAAAGEVIASAAVAFFAIGLVVAIGVAHRRRGLLDPLVRQVEERTGLPAWCALPLPIVGAGLVVAVWGYYWDVSWHIDRGRDPGAFANPAHWFIIVGLDLVVFGALLSVILGDDRSPASLRLTERWSVPAGSVLLAVCGVVSISGFPLDDIWHRLFGQDVTAWGPTHIQLIFGASLTTLGGWALLVEAERVVGRDALTAVGRLTTRVGGAALAGAFLIGLSTLQVEFDFGVPQFRAVYHPLLITLAASIALVAARIRLGRGGALLAVGFFLAARLAITAGVVALGRSTQHIPLYVVEALLVEAVAAWLGRDRQITLGAVAGALIGTVGMASEWAWSHAWMPLPWRSDLLPEAVLLCLVGGVAGGVLGGLVGRAVAPEGVERQATPRFALAAAWVCAVGVVGVALPVTEDTSLTATVAASPAGTDADTGAPLADLAVELSPGADDLARDAAWFYVLAWQGSDGDTDGGFVRSELSRSRDGTWRTDRAVPLGDAFKTVLRLHGGDAMQGVPLHLPADAELDAPAVTIAAGPMAFQREKSILQREARTDNVNAERAAYLALLGVAVLWMVTVSWGLGRLDRAAGGGRRPGTARARLGRPVPAPV
jgi:hypothetical protein